MPKTLDAITNMGVGIVILSIAIIILQIIGVMKCLRAGEWGLALIAFFTFGFILAFFSVDDISLMKWGKIKHDVKLRKSDVSFIGVSKPPNEKDNPEKSDFYT